MRHERTKKLNVEERRKWVSGSDYERNEIWASLNEDEKNQAAWVRILHVAVISSIRNPFFEIFFCPNSFLKDFLHLKNYDLLWASFIQI